MHVPESGDEIEAAALDGDRRRRTVVVGGGDDGPDPAIVDEDRSPGEERSAVDVYHGHVADHEVGRGRPLGLRRERGRRRPRCRRAGQHPQYDSMSHARPSGTGGTGFTVLSHPKGNHTVKGASRT